MSVDVKKITTEGINQKSMQIDKLTTIDALSLINEEDKLVPIAVESAIPQIAKLVDAITPKMEKGGRLIYLGAGTSGRIGLLDASECPPTYGVSGSTIQGLLAGGIEAFKMAVEGAEDSMELAVSDLKAINLTSGDSVVGIAASGRTPYVIGGIEYAKSIGALTGCIVNAKESRLASIVDYPIEAITGSEVISGSTRMKSGTAQKLICNMLSTTIMVKLGHTYGNLMVDLIASNEKLVARQINIIMQATSASKEEATAALAKYGSVKLSILAIITGIDDLNKLQQLLNKHNGHLKDAINEVIK